MNRLTTLFYIIFHLDIIIIEYNVINHIINKYKRKGEKYNEN